MISGYLRSDQSRPNFTLSLTRFSTKTFFEFVYVCTVQCTSQLLLIGLHASSKTYTGKHSIHVGSKLNHVPNYWSVGLCNLDPVEFA